MRYTKPIGIAILLAGGLAAAVSPFLHYDANISLWRAATREPILLTIRYPLILTILVVAAMMLGVVSLAVDRWLLLVLSGLISAFVVGETFHLNSFSYHLQAGFWLLTAGALVMSAGSVLALSGSITSLRRAERRAGIAFAADVATQNSGQHETQIVAAHGDPALPPSGWYPDPAGAAGERFWAGATWTVETRS